MFFELWQQLILSLARPFVRRGMEIRRDSANLRWNLFPLSILVLRGGRKRVNATTNILLGDLLMCTSMFRYCNIPTLSLHVFSTNQRPTLGVSAPNDVLHPSHVRSAPPHVLNITFTFQYQTTPTHNPPVFSVPISMERMILTLVHSHVLAHIVTFRLVFRHESHHAARCPSSRTSSWRQINLSDL